VTDDEHQTAEATARVASADEVARWLEGLHDYADSSDQPWLARAADLLRSRHAPTEIVAHILCLICRGTFTEEEVSGLNACPRCANRGVPADLRKVANATLTKHEWRILCMWAENWAERVAAKEDAEGYDSPRTVRAIANEIKRQAPDIGPLSLRDELQEVADRFGGEVELRQSGGESERFKPVTKQ
jgi:hypothetical protein